MAQDIVRPKIDKEERIAKRIARAGLCSRREAERWIAEGRVAIDEVVVSDPATKVSLNNKIVIDGELLPKPSPTELWRYHKPRGVITSHADPEDRPTVFDKVSERLGHVISVGRLDLNSEGLLLLTNDGDLARTLEHPSRGWVRRYRVRALGRPAKQELSELAKGITVRGIRYGPIQAQFDRQNGRNSWLTLSLAEGKNREIRLVLQHLGLTVNRLIRLAYGPFQLGKLKRGEIERIPPSVVRDQLGQKFLGSHANRRR